MLKTKLWSTGLFCQGVVLLVITGKINSGDTLHNLYAGKPAYNSCSPASITADSLFKKPVFSIEAINPNIEIFSKKYIQKNTQLFNNIKNLRQQQLKIIETIFQQCNLPVQLKYLAIVESKLKSTATSASGAKGIWQLMPATAISLGLKINDSFDERTHCYKSTTAAAKYLKQLYIQFNDWLLVIAAYNSGAGNVYKAIKKSGSRNFWELQYFLPLESRMHVKKFISTHYYFERTGSLTTISKEETEEYSATVETLQKSFQHQDKK